MSDIFARKDLSLQDKMLYNFVAHGLKILFVRPSRYRGLSYLAREKGAKITVLDTDTSCSALVKQFGGVFVNGDVYDSMPSFAPKEFDLVILDDIILSYVDVHLVLDYALGCSRYCLVSMTNYARLQNRLRFLFWGNFFGKRDFSPIMDSRVLHVCSASDFLQACFMNKISVKRACFYDNALKMQSVYNVLKFPNLMARKFYFVLSTDFVTLE